MFFYKNKYTIEKNEFSGGIYMQQLARNKLYEIEPVSNFRELINRSQKLYSDKIAFIYKKNPKDTTYVTHTYTELKQDIRKSWNWFNRFRTKPESVLLLLLLIVMNGVLVI